MVIFRSALSSSVLVSSHKRLSLETFLRDYHQEEMTPQNNSNKSHKTQQKQNTITQNNPAINHSKSNNSKTQHQINPAKKQQNTTQNPAKKATTKHNTTQNTTKHLL